MERRALFVPEPRWSLHGSFDRRCALIRLQRAGTSFAMAQNWEGEAPAEPRVEWFFIVIRAAASEKSYVEEVSVVGLIGSEKYHWAVPSH